MEASVFVVELVEVFLALAKLLVEEEELEDSLKCGWPGVSAQSSHDSPCGDILSVQDAVASREQLGETDCDELAVADRRLL